MVNGALVSKILSDTRVFENAYGLIAIQMIVTFALIGAPLLTRSRPALSRRLESICRRSSITSHLWYVWMLIGDQLDAYARKW